MKVIFDFDLGELYAVETKALNQAVSRNLSRFPDDFMSGRRPKRSRISTGHEL
jgi:hypothetical protein